MVGEVDAERGAVVAADAEQPPHRAAQCRRDLAVGVGERDARGQARDRERRAPPAQGTEDVAAVPILRRAAACGLAAVVGVQERDLRLGAGQHVPAPAGADRRRDLARQDPDELVVVAVGLAQQQLVVVVRGQPPAEQGPLGGGDDVDAGGGALPHDAGHVAEQPALVVLVEDGGTGRPSRR